MRNSGLLTGNLFGIDLEYLTKILWYLNNIRAADVLGGSCTAEGEISVNNGRQYNITIVDDLT